MTRYPDIMMRRNDEKAGSRVHDGSSLHACRLGVRAHVLTP
jgi:hypothetical protein